MPRRRFCKGKPLVARKLSFGYDAQARLLRGVDALADAVKVTLGPAGGHVLLDRPGEAPRVTRDGASVAEELALDDLFAQQGLRLARRAAATAAEKAGDGSTTATVLAQAIAREGLKLAAGGLNPLDLKRGVDLAVGRVCGILAERSQPVDSADEIARVGAISANGDAEIGALVARAIDMVGGDGVINAEAGNSQETEIDVVRGIRFDQGYVSPYFMTDPETTRCDYADAYILLYDGKLSRHEPLLKLLEASVTARRPLLIVAQEIEGEALRTLVTSKVKGGLKVAAAKAPSFGDRRAAILEDIAIMTGGDLISEQKGLSLDNAGPEVFGAAGHVELTRTDTTIIRGAGDPAAIESRCEEIRHQIPDALSDFNRDRLRERLARLAGGIAVIRAGGATEAEIAERRERIESAISATRAAMEEGVLPGGGAALFHAAQGLDGLAASNADQRAGIEIVRRALGAPLTQIADNAGTDGAAIAAKLAAETDPNVGFDAVAGACRDMAAAGIVDPAKVVRTALMAAASVAGLVLTAEVIVARLPEPPPLPLDQRPFGPESPDMLPEDLDRFGLR